MTHTQMFNRHGALYLKDIVSKDLCQFFTHVLSRAHLYNSRAVADTQVPGSLGVLDHEYMFDTLLERVWPLLEVVLEDELLPTYTYSRLYTNGNILEKHSDRPSCEISVTIQLARTHHYSWPIFMGDQRFDLAEGDGVVYKGCDIEHWRDECNGPPGYKSGQVFLHFVRARGQHAHHANDVYVRGDSNRDIGELRQQNDFFLKNRNFLVENK